MRCRMFESLFPRLLVCCAVALGISTLPATAEAGKSHLNQKSSQHVTLVWSAIAGAAICPGSPGYGFLEVPANGAVAATQAFVVPEKQALHVTDLAWAVTGGLVQGRYLEFGLYVDPSLTVPSFQAAVVIDAALAASGTWNGQSSLTSGFVVGAGATFCPVATDNYFGGGGGGVALGHVVLHGYLMNGK